MLARQIAIGFGIAIIFPLLIYYGVSTFYHAPRWEDFVKSSQPYNATTEERRDYEEKLKKEREAYRSAAKDFSRVMVIVATPFGVAAILIGAFLTIHAIGTGLILGGIATVAIGYYGYWSYLDDWIRFVSLLVGFAILLFVGFRLLPSRARIKPS